MTHSYIIWHDSSIRDVTHWYDTPGLIIIAVEQDITIALRRLTQMSNDSLWCKMTHSYMTRLIHTWHDPLIWHTRTYYHRWVERYFNCPSATHSDFKWLTALLFNRVWQWRRAKTLRCCAPSPPILWIYEVSVWLLATTPTWGCGLV